MPPFLDAYRRGGVQEPGGAASDLEKQHMGETGGVIENYLTVTDVAERLKVNEETVRRLFQSEPGVLVICFPRRGRRVYRTLRIPETVFQRVLIRLTRAS